ncbi:endo-1,4-beta-xylanase [Pseudarthrobacter enclensis]|uniref:endo-1,4-beta-xylanase n=1 Tax=Pseudarthrobacter enclensis TaxID=993070 RepID=A0A0V8IVL3_9MICC|nr:endo-1,4-beta-xylanase [Pseudarthrobacter enclensis]KSU78789.1 glycoside hydrolase [Pseudarthrobacter enclensis]SCB77457.1 endo-1,4-beta-xylanase [Pseudarthrobacter enclensis]
MAWRRRILMALASGLLLAAAGCTPNNPEPDVVLDLLRQDWGNTPGVTPDGGGLRVAATSRTIVEQDGGGGQPNPPLNLAGTHLEAKGDFTLSATLTDVTADASWSVYDSPPVIADEFRIEPAGVRLTLRGNELDIAVFDGSRQETATAPRPAHEERVTLQNPDTELSVRRAGDRLEVAGGGKTLLSQPLQGVFGSGQLWLGLASDAGTFQVSSLTATAPEGSPLTAAGPAVEQAAAGEDGLQALAGRIRPGFRLGAAVALGPLASDPDYGRVLVGNFGAITPENAMKAQNISPQQGVYTFGEADAILAVAESKGLAVHGHTIAFTEAMPRWMQDLPAGTDAERRSSATALLDYVSAVVTHFKGRLDSLDVVNEPFDTDQGTGLQENIWYRVFGPGYPAAVSRAVYDADPDVKQYINENGADVPGPRQDALLRLALDTNARGGHIYGVGLQAHVYNLETDAIPARDLARTLRTFQDAGLLVRISENDVVDDDGTEAQAQQYAAVVETCLRSSACVSYTTWGVDNRYDWLIDDDGSLQQGHDYLFENGQPTAPYHAVRKVLGG